MGFHCHKEISLFEFCNEITNIDQPDIKAEVKLEC